MACRYRASTPYVLFRRALRLRGRTRIESVRSTTSSTLVLLHTIHFAGQP